MSSLLSQIERFQARRETGSTASFVCLVTLIAIYLCLQLRASRAALVSFATESQAFCLKSLGHYREDFLFMVAWSCLVVEASCLSPRTLVCEFACSSASRTEHLKNV